MSRNEQTSYIFANCKGERAHIISQIERIANVESTTPVTGRFDLVIKLRTNEPSKAYTIMEKIRDIPSITNTQTAISFESISNSSNESDNESPLAFALLKVKGAFGTNTQDSHDLTVLIQASSSALSNLRYSTSRHDGRRFNAVAHWEHDCPCCV